MFRDFGLDYPLFQIFLLLTNSICGMNCVLHTYQSVGPLNRFQSHPQTEAVDVVICTISAVR